MGQPIHLAPSQPKEVHELTLRGKESMNWENALRTFIHKWNNRDNYVEWNDHPNHLLGRQSKYMMWYLRHTRRWMTELGATQGYVIDRIQTSIQKLPPTSHASDPTNVDDVVPITSRERGGLGRRRRREEAVELRQEIAEDRQPGMYYVPQPYPYYTFQAPYQTYFYPRLPDLNTQLFDESTSEDVNEDVRRNPHRGAKDKHWQCGT
ncbi:hypothetical protein RIF29_15209 [Crotalaria pallida]|uniref:Uncharacterized protein n=1 Tax=Crotalaria pallida TaxID=3830 RepID=A0AAN9ICE3_CROPI